VLPLREAGAVLASAGAPSEVAVSADLTAAKAWEAGAVAAAE